MINSVEIENFRGIRRGALKDLGALTILTGPNGCGKSTIVDALLIAASPKPWEGVGQAVERHRATHDGARWLIGREGEAARIFVKTQRTRGSELKWERIPIAEASGGIPPHSRIWITVVDYVGDLQENTFFAAGYKEIVFSGDGSYTPGQSGGIPIPSSPLGHVRLVDSSTPVPLDEAFSGTFRQGRKKDVLALLEALVSDLDGVEILVEDDRTPMVYVDDGRNRVPASLSGDGIYAFLQLALELAASPGGLVLVEEPEVFQHLRAIRQSARALVAAVRRGVQIVVTTHSLELIDAILGESEEEDRERLVLFNLLLSDGELKSSRFPGPDVAFARESMEKDLR